MRRWIVILIVMNIVIVASEKIVDIKTLTLTISQTSLNRDSNSTIKVEATYSNQTTKDVTDQIEWIIDNKDAVEIQDHTLTAKKDINTTLKAKLDNLTSNTVTLNIYWEIDGHTLPPEPNKAINNSTLLGIDVNHNGVRDDVERWIYQNYKDKHPIHIDIAMQAARAYKLVLETPERAGEIHDNVVNAPYFCSSYYKNYAKLFGDPILVRERIDTPVKSKYFNTKTRNDIYREYDVLLSGGSYDMPWPSEMKLFCDFNTTKYNKE